MPASRRPKSTHSRFARWLKIGIDISGQTSKAFDAVTSRPWDYAMTVCDIANERCPKFPERTRRVHWGIKDPALAVATEEERMAAFRSARHELDEWIQVWLDEQAAAQRERRARGPGWPFSCRQWFLLLSQVGLSDRPSLYWWRRSCS